MKLLLLGTGGYHPNDRRHTACLMLPEIGVVLDAGTAFYRVREHLATEELDVYLTHAHLDHVIGITFLFDVLWGHEGTRVTVRGEAHVLREMREHLFAPALFPVLPPLTMETLEAERPLPGGGRLTHFPLDHPGGAIGFRLDWPDRSLAYVSDTTAHRDAAYVERIRGVDLLIHECYFPDELADRAELTGHSCTTPVAEVAARAQVGRLVLVHVNPLSTEADPIDLAKARALFPNVELGFDGMTLDF